MAKAVNARLKKIIEKRYGSVAEFCKQEPGCEELADEISALINLEKYPLNLDGTPTKVCRILSETLDAFFEKLFPLRLYRDVLPKGIEVMVFTDFPKRVKKDLMHIADNYDPTTKAEQHQLSERIEKVMKTLFYREREVIKLRFGLGDGYSYTLEEVGHIFKVTRARIRQIEADACRKLQAEVRAKTLREFLD